jgi:hypothetical protein
LPLMPRHTSKLPQPSEHEVRNDRIFLHRLGSWHPAWLCDLGT